MTESAETARSPAHQLSRTLRERDLLYLFVGSVIGSGIFVTPGLILRQLGGSVGYSVLVWLVALTAIVFLWRRSSTAFFKERSQ